MKKAYLHIAGILTVFSLVACDEYLTTSPQTIITDQQIWNDGSLVTNVLANLYNRVPQHQGLENFAQWQDFAAFDEALYSGVTAGAQFRNSMANYPYDGVAGSWNIWQNAYGLLRDTNLAMENITAGSLAEPQKSRFIAELRFLRALVHFELVKRYGGVPIVTTQLLYDFSGDPSSVQLPRDSEADVYDFVASEVDAIASQLGNVGSRTRANRFSALALKSRAMLYAGSIAKHNNGVVPALPNGEVGIPAGEANSYFQKSLAASMEIINSGAYSLAQGGDPSQAFWDIFITKSTSEVILAKDYRVSQGKAQFYTMQTYPQSIPNAKNANWNGAALSTTLNLVENFDMLDGSSGVMQGVGDGTAASQANWIFYDELDDIFAGRDARLWATVMLPGTSFAGQPLQFQAGVYVWNEGTGRYDRQSGGFGSTYVGDGGILTGLDGPVPATDYVSNSGFYPRKYADPSPAAAQVTGSDNWWVLFRLGEVYMNAAEAAFELGMTTEALGYVNTLRQRAGFPANSLTSLTLGKIQSERWNELAYEDHRLWDLKRWRIAHILWDGSAGTPTANLNVLYPYRVIRPGHPNHNKYVFDRFKSTSQDAPRFFRPGNYYTLIPDAVIDSNPLITRNPFH